MSRAKISNPVRPGPGSDGRHATFCRLCEANCGLVATVSDGRIVKVEPDRDNPHSQGHVCVKGMAFHQVTHDPDRVLTPLRRCGGPGEFEPVDWDEALTDIAGRLRTIRERDGGEAIAFYVGNPSSFATDMAMSFGQFMRALGTRKGYSPGSQDTNARYVANYALFGAGMLNAFPDLTQCDFLLVLGGNPLVSNGSILYAPRIRHDLDAVAKRGQVVVVDPRMTETARRYGHVPIRPNGDVWLLLGMLRVLADEALFDLVSIARNANGFDFVKEQVSRIEVETAAIRCGVPSETIRDLARKLATTRNAAVYGRLGLCRGPFATLVNALVTTLDVVTGHFGERRGSTIFGHPVIAGHDRPSSGGYAEAVSRIGDVPTVARFHASAIMPDDFLEPGPGQTKALMLAAGNPMLSAPGGEKLERALEGLELFVSFDFYVNETSRFADYVLPTTTFYERPDVPYVVMNALMRPFLHYTDAVIDPVGEARPEHEIWQEIVARMGLEWPVRASNDFPDNPGIARMDAALRGGPVGDALGENEGWSIDRLREYPHGVMADNLPDPTENWRERLGNPDKRIRLDHPLIAGEFDRLWAEWREPEGLALITRRDIRSINSWMHNIDGLVRSQRPDLLVNHEDGERLGLADGGNARLFNDYGELAVTVAFTDEVGVGTVCYQHGFGHDGGWQRANAAPGKNMNVLLALGAGPDAIEFVSGTTLMDGIQVQLEPLRNVAAA